jgi:hypothetical protein
LKLLKQSLAPPRFNAGIQANKLHRSYPLRLRQQGYVTPSAPTITQRANFRNFETLKERTLHLQRRAAMLRNSHRSALVPPNTGQKGERHNKNKRLRPPWVPKPPRPSQRNAKYCPVPAAHSPIRSQSRRSLLVSASPPTRSLLTSTRRVIPRLSAWLFKPPLVCANLLAPKPIRVQSSGTRAQASPSLPTSPTFMAQSPRQERSHSSKGSQKVYKSKAKAKSIGPFTISLATSES